MPSDQKPVLILGAGVHGAAIALQLVRNNVPVRLVDAFDIAYGATSKSSRLIHGGLRYLEYGDFKLVRESLRARTMNMGLATPFVQPLRLYIPLSRRWSGLKQSAIGFLGLSRTAWGRRQLSTRTGRGYWPVRIGLWMYDRLAQSRGGLPPSATMSVDSHVAPRVNSRRYRWLCSYSDAQMLFPERLVLALLAEAEQVAAENKVDFQVSTYTRAEFREGLIHLASDKDGLATLDPACIVNATGAWGDSTLEQLQINSPALFGGTKGTHFATWNGELQTALKGQAVYAEADDGRLVFILPFGDGVLVGTTDETFAAKPETAVATEEELAYLLHLVNEVMDCRLTRDDIVLHYSGVRPLPRATAANNAAVSRDHSLIEHDLGGRSVLTLVGGKLTTWREFGREVTDRVLSRLERHSIAEMVDTPVLGSQDSRGRPFPITDEECAARFQELVTDFSAPEFLIAALWPLYGTRMAAVLADCQGEFGPPIFGTHFTTGVVRWVIDHEWVRSLPDLIERRLMLVFGRDLSRTTLVELADCLVATGKLALGDADHAVAAAIERLRTVYGRRVE